MPLTPLAVLVGVVETDALFWTLLNSNPNISCTIFIPTHGGRLLGWLGFNLARRLRIDKVSNHNRSGKISRHSCSKQVVLVAQVITFMMFYYNASTQCIYKRYAMHSTLTR